MTKMLFFQQTTAKNSPLSSGQILQSPRLHQNDPTRDYSKVPTLIARDQRKWKMKNGK
jgi:hypothetical protein